MRDASIEHDSIEATAYQEPKVNSFDMKIEISNDAGTGGWSDHPSSILLWSYWDKYPQ